MAETQSATIPFGPNGELKLETGKLARQAGGAIMLTQGETVILVAATVAPKPKEGTDFFPMTVDYEERMYAAGKISGSRFIKREGRPSEEAILKSRIVDRSIRPMFPKGFRRDVQIIITTLAYDDEHDTAALAVIGASAALLKTDAPFEGPVAAVRVGLVDNELILNPTLTQMENSTLDLLASGTAKKITMIEVQSNEVPEEKMAEALEFAQKAIAECLEPQKTFVAPDKEKVEFTEHEAWTKVKEFVADKIEAVVEELDLDKRSVMFRELEEKVIEKFGEEFTETDLVQGLNAAFNKQIRALIIEKGKRPDGRAMDEVRPLSIEVGVLPRVHGSGLFTRGETQALTVTTLGSPGEEQWIDTMEENSKKRYMHHYNFPPYSTGEVKPLRGGNRREIGHGALAEKALVPMIPSKEDFPYTIRLVSEILGSNGSSSMAAVCGSTMSLMDAGVPIKKPVAGVAMGLVSADSDDSKFQVLTDLQGLEDFAGEMDFKIAGTKDGITAIQLDVKNKGLTSEVIKQTFADAKTARLFVLDTMLKTLSAPRTELSPNAPRIITTSIDPEKIGELIGPGGKVINKIIDDHGGKDILNIDIEEDGTVLITSIDPEAAMKVKAIVEGIGKPINVGEEFEGPVISIVKDRNSGKEIGAIVQLTPNRDGMIHISALGNGQFVNSVSEVCKIGDTLKVKVKEVDNDKGRISLSRVS
ncbi:MAG TPA: polyribonucleotide nucleotidyltransferase [Candidatus Saccharimonadales bacterium]|nr:polyribonucleotide nucleotidyltransferase [Candidatus Saccharimonadales bacterium]